jgi:DNA invertase Pin-like site-specific DNA recombinase
LIRDVEAGEVDAVIVYKIDRLTRTLLDFVRLIDLFDRNSISFVSISQSFDMSDSMGRMILNILLTFSQFERELIGERVRDSIRMRKRHGKVHGGHPPFGYISTESGIQIVEKEAEVVRFLFAEFLRTERYTAVMGIARERNFCTSVKYTKRGLPRGGKQMSPGTIYNILRNPIYVGEIRGHDTTYPGRHEPIISRETWEAAQALCAARKRKTPHAQNTDHFLAGLLWDDLGRHMLLRADENPHNPKHSYFSSNATWSYTEYRRQYHCNADRLEKLVTCSVVEFLGDRRSLRSALKILGVYGEELERLAAKGRVVAARLEADPASG